MNYRSTDRHLTVHRVAIAAEHPALPAKAGKIMKRARTFVRRPIPSRPIGAAVKKNYRSTDRHLTVRPVARPKPVLDKLAALLLQMMQEDVRRDASDPQDRDAA